MTKPHSRLRKGLLALVAAPALAVAVIGAEVALAINAPRLPNKAPYDLNRTGTAKARRVLWVGDSTAAGVGATSVERALPNQVAERLGDDVKATLVSRSVSGATTADVLHDQLGGLTDEKFDRIYVSVGANDVTALTSAGAFNDAYSAMLESRPAADEVILLGIPDMGSVPRFAQPLRAIAGWRGEQLDDIIEAQARKNGFTYVDIAGETGSAFRSNPVRNFAADDYHPSDEGYRLWADAVVGAVNAVAPED